MNIQGMISVIVPVYNGEEHIGHTIGYILDATYQNLEVVLINDGSTDNSVTIIERYAEKDSRVRLITQENGGIVAARNTGLQYAQGEYIHFCDQDDVVMPDMYQQMISRIIKDESGLAICSALKFNEKEELMLEWYKDDLLIGEEIKREILYPMILNGFCVEKNTNYTTGSHIWNVLMKADIVRNNNMQFKRFVNYEDDLLMNVDLLSKVNSVSLIQNYGYKWRVNLKSESHRMDKYIEKYYEKKTNLINYILDTIGREDKKSVEEYLVYRASYDLVKILKNEMAKDNPKTFTDKMKYLKKLGDDYTGQTLRQTARNCYLINWKIILYVCSIFGIRVGYICNYFLLGLIRLLDRMNISMLVEKIVTKKKG